MATKANGNGKATKARTIVTETRTCDVQLTEAERAARGNEMSECELAIETLKSERSELSRRVRDREKRRNELGHVLERGTESREVTCEWVPVFAQNVLRLCRADTGEIVEERAMTAEDRQGQMFAVPDDDVPPTPPAPPAPPRKPRRKSAPPATAA